MTCATSEDSDQPGHPASLIRVFVVRMKEHWSSATHKARSKDSNQSGWMPRLILGGGAHISFCLFCRAAAHMFLFQASIKRQEANDVKDKEPVQATNKDIITQGL